MVFVLQVLVLLFFLFWLEYLREVRQIMPLQKMNDNKSLSCNLEKQRQKLQRLRRQLDFIRNDYMNKQVAQIIRLRPQYIVMEPFDMEKMVSDKNIKRGTARAKYYDLKNRLLIKCQKYNLELKETEHPAKEAEMILMMDIV